MEFFKTQLNEILFDLYDSSTKRKIHNFANQNGLTAYLPDTLLEDNSLFFYVVKNNELYDVRIKAGQVEIVEHLKR